MGKPRASLWSTDHALEAICQASSSAIVALDPQGTVHLWNPSAERIFGWRREEVMGRPVNIIPPESWDELHGFLHHPTEGEALRGVKVQKLRKDGTPVDLRLFGAPLRDDQGNINGFLGIFRELSACKRGEAKLLRTSRVLKTLSACNRAVLRATGEKAFLDEVCRHIVEIGGYRQAWIGLARTDSSTEVHRMALAGEPAIPPASDPGEEALGKDDLWRSALRLGQTVLGHAGATASAASDQREESRTSSLALPLRQDSRVSGVLVLSTREPETFDAEEIKFLEELAEDVAFGLVSLRTRVQHRLAQERITRLHGLIGPILHSVREGIVGLDLTGNHTFVNPAAAQMLGYEAAELLGRHAHSTWHHSRPDGSPFPEQECPACATLHDGTVHHSSEEIFWRKDGAPLGVEFTSAPIRENGSTTGAVVTFRDITERQQAEEKLCSTRDQLERLLSCSPAIIYSCRFEGNYDFTFISKNVTSFLGYEPQEFLEDSGFWHQHVHPQDRLRLLAELPSLEPRGSLSVEYRFRAKDGTWHWMEDDRKLVLDAAGKPLEVIGSWIDVTARKEAEKVIREAREYAESIIETLHEPLMVLDEQLRVISANRAFYQVFQAIPDETENRFLYELDQRQWDIPKLRELLQEIIPQNSYLQDFEVQHHFPHLGRKEMLLNARRILREGEGTQLILLAIEDVTEHKQAEENLRRSLENLRRALGETTTALASAAEIRDPYTAGHQQRVAQLAGAIGREMGCTEDQLEAIRVAGILHDIGKLYVPSEILSKPTRLSDLEFAMIKTHSQVGFDILKEIQFPWPVAQIVLQHHERMNGSGYPMGLSASEILPEARILAVADVVEAMASHRPYRPALGIQKALQEISRHRDILYDPEVVDVCLQLFTEGSFQFT